MIKSVSFPNDGKGYVYAHPDEPVRPNRRDREFYDKTPEEYKKGLNKYYKEHKKWEKEKDNYVCPCAKNLIGKKFDFEDHKVNVIFGRNGSGKSTIIRQIGGTALIEKSGFTSIHEPLDFGWGEEKNVEYLVNKYKMNSSSVEWDGAPVYLYNPDVLTTFGGSFGEMANTLFNGDTSSEITYILGGSRVSSGQRSALMLNRIMSVCEMVPSMKQLVSYAQTQLDKGRMNETWMNTYRCQLDYLKGFKNFDKEGPTTLVFDEIDKSLDIPTVIFLYTEFFPRLVKKYGTQVILVSHNPLILSKNIIEQPEFNLISVDDEYTTNVRKTLNGISF